MSLMSIVVYPSIYVAMTTKTIRQQIHYIHEKEMIMFTEPKQIFNAKQTARFVEVIQDNADLQHMICEILRNGVTTENLALLTRTAYDLGKIDAVQEMGDLLENIEP